MNFLDNTNCEDFHLVKIGENIFVLEECKNFQEGLSKKEHLHENEGMLFMFPDKSNRSFHMKDCIINLDILFLEDGIIKKIFHNCPPCLNQDCLKFECDSCDSVIELAGGTCKNNNITEGLIYRHF